MSREFHLALIRGCDLLFAAALLVLLAPLLAAAALAVRLTIGTPVLFRQERAGKDNRPFRIIKFRTMRTACDAAGNPLPDEERLTRLGRLLRKSSVDELPELLNVLRGEMSLVGPRPLFLEYHPYYIGRERLRLTVRPGITGLAQISGRNYIDWETKLGLDADYVERLSLGLYLKILLSTPLKVLNWRSVAVNPWTAEQPLSIARAGRAVSHPEESP